MTTPPRLTDRAALARNRTRARAAGNPAMFLHEDCVAEVQERLSLVNRRFTKPAIVTAFPEIWQDALPGATYVPDDEVLALQPGAHDLVVHAMALHWADDPVGQLVQCRRALRPDGLLLCLFPGGQTLHELRASLAEAETGLTGGLSPRVSPMAEIRDAGGLLQRAGFALPVADSFTRTASYRDALHLARDLRAMGEGNALADRHRRFAPRALFAATAATYARHFPLPEDRIRATFEIFVLTGWSPDASQPKPLRPGSAAARLAEALDTPEITLPDPATPQRD